MGKQKRTEAFHKIQPEREHRRSYWRERNCTSGAVLKNQDQDSFKQEANSACGAVSQSGTELKNQLSPEPHDSEVRDREGSRGKTQAVL